jgi:23S rRNA pseudouridine1911/1915/1917 synthase
LITGRWCAVVATMDQLEETAIHALGDCQVLYEDNHLLGLLKPAGLLSQATRRGDDTLVDRAGAYLRIRGNKPGKAYVGLLHRLDRNVSGVVLLARTSKAASRLSRAFAERTVDKLYLAVVSGVAHEEAEVSHRLAARAEGRGVEESSEGKEAILRYRRLATGHQRSLLEVHLLTGRKHQIRVQLALIGHPVVGDPLYGTRSRSINRPALHAASLSFTHPISKKRLKISAPIADEMKVLVDRFAKCDEP